MQLYKMYLWFDKLPCGSFHFLLRDGRHIVLAWPKNIANTIDAWFLLRSCMRATISASVKRQ